jgi:hypothetical protein
MSEEHKKPDHDLALGQSIAAAPEMRALKEEAALRFASGDSEETVLGYLLEAVQPLTSDTERMVGMDRVTADWLLDWAKTGEPGALNTGVRGTVMAANWPDEEGGESSLWCLPSRDRPATLRNSPRSS